MRPNIFHVFVNIYKSPLVKHLFKSFVHFLVVFVLTVDFESFSYILAISSLLDIQFANVFSHFTAHLSNILTGLFTDQKFLILISQISLSLFFMDSSFLSCHQILSPKDFLQGYFLKSSMLLYFYLYLYI